MEAYDHIVLGNIDLVFLDINMPQLNGLELVQTLKSPPEIILTTAHREFAVKAYELNVLDYLVKPISLPRFLKAISKMNSRFISLDYAQPDNRIGEQRTDLEDTAPVNVLYMKSDRKVVKVDIERTLFFESLNDKVIVHLEDREFSTNQRIGYLEEKLPSEYFTRVHRSYIVNISKVNAFSKIELEIGEKTIPIGRNFRNETLKKLTK